MRIRSAIVTLVVVALIIGAFFIPARAQGRRDVVTVVLGQEPAELFQGFVSNLLVESDVEEPLYCAAIERRDDWKLYPELAEKVPSLKDGDWKILPGKKMQITFKLKKGWKWQDGKPVTAGDFVWTFRMRKNPRTPVVSRFVENKIENVLATDPYTVTFQYSELFPYANEGNPVFPSHILLRDYNRAPEAFDRIAYARAPIHCGPYRLKEWAPGSHIELVASPETWGGEKPKINRIIFRFILDSTVMAANLMGNQGDATGTHNFNDPAQIDEIVQRNPRLEGHYDEGLNWEHIDFNMDNEWLKDKRVRQAMIYGIDRQAMVQALFRGRQPVAHTFFGPRHFAHHKDIKKYNFDQARARQLLAEAGFTPGPDGILRDSRGRRFEMTIMTTAGAAVREQVEQIVKDHLRQIGIDLRIDNRPASVLFGQVTRERTFPHLVMYAWSSGPTTHYQTIWKSTEIPTRENNFVGQNTPGYRNPEVDRLLDASLEEFDEAKRRDLLIKVQDLWAEDLPSIPLYFRIVLNVSQKGLQGYKPRGFGGVPWNSEAWAWTQ